MYLVLLHGQGTSVAPSASGLPTLCRQGTNSPPSPSWSSTARPMRVMIFMFATTYGESVISTPITENGEPSGPMQNGTTYIVRPFMQPEKTVRSLSFMSAGAIQLLVGPASTLRWEQMKVRSSTRATSLGSEQAR